MFLRFLHFWCGCESLFSAFLWDFSRVHLAFLVFFFCFYWFYGDVFSSFAGSLTPSWPPGTAVSEDPKLAVAALECEFEEAWGSWVFFFFFQGFSYVFFSILGCFFKFFSFL